MKPIIITAALTLVFAGLVPTVAAADPLDPALATKLAGHTVFLDPGHQGANHSENLSRQVDNGRGGTKDCQTTGMTTVNGVAEHTITWNVAQLVKVSLESLGARVVLSRQDDSGWGGCVDDRARAANDSGATVAVSIHADSGPAGERGFHLIVPRLPIPDAAADRAQSGAGRAVTTSVRDAYVQGGFPAATYAGVSEGLQTRADVAGPALTTVPLVFLEMGNGANPEDAAVLESGDGQLRHAIALTTGLVGYLLGAPVTATDDLPASAPARTESDSPALEDQAPSAADSRTGTEPEATEPETADLGPAGEAAELLMPLLRALGKDREAITAELINLVYTLAATLFPPTK